MGDLSYSLEKKTLTNTKTHTIISLTTAEKTLLDFFSSHIGQPISREELGSLTQQKDNMRAVDVQITRLRKKIEPDPKKPQHLQTVRNKGYVFIADNQTD